MYEVGEEDIGEREEAAVEEVEIAGGGGQAPADGGNGTPRGSDRASGGRSRGAAACRGRGGGRAMGGGPRGVTSGGGEDRADRKSTRLNSSHLPTSRMPSSA